MYDYYQLGETYYELKEYKNALKSFNKQTEINEFADKAYYKSTVFKIVKNDKEYRKYKAIALKL